MYMFVCACACVCVRASAHTCGGAGLPKDLYNSLDLGSSSFSATLSWPAFRASLMQPRQQEEGLG